MRGEKHDISLNILHKTGFEAARQAMSLAKCHTLTIVPSRPSLTAINQGSLCEKSMKIMFFDVLNYVRERHQWIRHTEMA